MSEPDYTNKLDQILSSLANIQVALARIEATMATKADITRLEARMLSLTAKPASQASDSAGE